MVRSNKLHLIRNRLHLYEKYSPTCPDIRIYQIRTATASPLNQYPPYHTGKLCFSYWETISLWHAVCQNTSPLPLHPVRLFVHLWVWGNAGILITETFVSIHTSWIYRKYRLNRHTLHGCVFFYFILPGVGPGKSLANALCLCFLER